VTPGDRKALRPQVRAAACTSDRKGTSHAKKLLLLATAAVLAGVTGATGLAAGSTEVEQFSNTSPANVCGFSGTISAHGTSVFRDTGNSTFFMSGTFFGVSQTGLRISEAIELRWRDVDFRASTFEVRRRLYRDRVAPPKPKYGRRTIKLSPSMARALWPLQGDPNDLVFKSAKRHCVDQSNLMSRVLKPAAVRTGVGEWVKTKNGSRAGTWVGHHIPPHVRNPPLQERLERQASPGVARASLPGLHPGDVRAPSREGSASSSGSVRFTPRVGHTGATKPTEMPLIADVVEQQDPAPVLVVARAV
jgi:hypothetical protein